MVKYTFKLVSDLSLIIIQFYFHLMSVLNISLIFAYLDQLLFWEWWIHCHWGSQYMRRYCSVLCLLLLVGVKQLTMYRQHMMIPHWESWQHHSQWSEENINNHMKNTAGGNNVDHYNDGTCWWRVGGGCPSYVQFDRKKGVNVNNFPSYLQYGSFHTRAECLRIWSDETALYWRKFWRHQSSCLSLFCRLTN